jgi:hypothetical protein
MENGKLVEAACLALGYIVGKEGEHESIAFVLASALKDAGSQSVYIDRIIEINTPKETVQ